ncbi:MAG: 50S ribosomal protein L6 [Candidatus Sumerlaeota bacterium]
MSRIGNNPITIPPGVDVKIAPDMSLTVKGPKGQLELDTRRNVKVKVEDNAVLVERHSDSKQDRAYHGLYQRLITNMVLGVTEGFKKELEIQGVGYRVQKSAKGLELSLGYSHPIQFEAPEGITLDAPEQTVVVVEGADKQQVGQVAARIRKLRPPEPYKGKGVRYKGEYVRRKVGKTGA